jgi:hypothetical protein
MMIMMVIKQRLQKLNIVLMVGEARQGGRHER